MDRLIYTAMSSLKQLDHMKMKYANALTNASTVGFKQSMQFATETSQVAGAGFLTPIVPRNLPHPARVFVRRPLYTTGR